MDSEDDTQPYEGEEENSLEEDDDVSEKYELDPSATDLLDDEDKENQDSHDGSEDAESIRLAQLSAFSVVRTPSRPNVLGDEDLPTQSVSDEVDGKLEAYNSLGVVSALLAGFAFSGLTAVDDDELEKQHWFIGGGFTLTTSLTIALNLLTLVMVTWVYFYARLLLGYQEYKSSAFFMAEKNVAHYRQYGILGLLISIPIFCISLAFCVLVKVPFSLYCYSLSAFFVFIALYLSHVSYQIYLAFQLSKKQLIGNETINQALVSSEEENRCGSSFGEWLKWVVNPSGICMYCLIVTLAWFYIKGNLSFKELVRAINDYVNEESIVDVPSALEHMDEIEADLTTTHVQ